MVRFESLLAVLLLAGGAMLLVLFLGEQAFGQYGYGYTYEPPTTAPNTVTVPQVGQPYFSYRGPWMRGPMLRGPQFRSGTIISPLIRGPQIQPRSLISYHRLPPRIIDRRVVEPRVVEAHVGAGWAR
jgi:hypothetical protein